MHQCFFRLYLGRPLCLLLKLRHPLLGLRRLFMVMRRLGFTEIPIIAY
jgi:hypothetical protein